MALSGSTLETQFKLKKEIDRLLVISSLQFEHTGKSEPCFVLKVAGSYSLVLHIMSTVSVQGT